MVRPSSHNPVRTAVLCEAALRTKSVSTKVSEDEFAALEARARARKLSEWVRAELLEPRNDAGGAGTEVLLGEVLALRTILMNLLFSIGKGEPTTPEQMQALIERADKDKMRRAMERLTAARATFPEPGRSRNLKRQRRSNQRRADDAGVGVEGILEGVVEPDTGVDVDGDLPVASVPGGD